MLAQQQGFLSATPPFDFAQSLRFLGGFEPVAGEHVIAEGAVTKALWIGEQPIAFRVEAAGSAAAPGLRYTLFSAAPLAPDEAQAATARVAAFFGLDDALPSFYAVGRADRHFAPVIARLYGYHQVRFPSPFENACWAVLTQRTPISLARRAKQRLTERFGGSVALDGVEYWAFPDAARLAMAGPDALLELVGNERRARYLQAVAEAFATTDEGWLRAAPWDDVYHWLRDIDGIGPWSATFVMVRGIGRMERLPVGETRLAEVAARVYDHGDRAATDDEIAAFAAPYGDQRGYWAHYLRAAG
jgi:DNA-3-methyladenine glycosylase II